MNQNMTAITQIFRNLSATATTFFGYGGSSNGNKSLCDFRVSAFQKSSKPMAKAKSSFRRRRRQLFLCLAAIEG
jgi:hypothetical protein